jgi:hypothetical protein
VTSNVSVLVYVRIGKSLAMERFPIKSAKKYLQIKFRTQARTGM